MNPKKPKNKLTARQWADAESQKVLATLNPIPVGHDEFNRAVVRDIHDTIIAKAAEVQKSKRKLPKITVKKGKRTDYFDYGFAASREALALLERVCLTDSERRNLKRKADHFKRCCDSLKKK